MIVRINLVYIVLFLNKNNNNKIFFKWSFASVSYLMFFFLFYSIYFWKFKISTFSLKKQSSYFKIFFLKVFS